MTSCGHSLVNSSGHFWVNFHGHFLMVITNSANTVGQGVEREAPARSGAHCSVPG